MLDTKLSSNIAQIAADLRTIEQKADAKLRAINTRAGRQILAVARAVVHVQTGRLRDSLRIEGPFDIVSGSFELRVVTNVPYAEEEIARGGEHDYATRTVQDSAGIVDQAAEDMERAIVVLMEEAG